ncbi:DUF930 domain-containing protein [Neorhizobium alkalisoli]|uniref:Uncharacterized protein DUF930 n=1 Tax=Neorhizobium alkalisoli TaxID=528178 RepID=A0A561QBM0_9HYPH|nr:DUF930 domain-containing protein [Neorhizobium alkalisoli]TWF47764.1 uncharacterized protein DUF930 [Neorhizobium alkalisoli]
MDSKAPFRNMRKPQIRLLAGLIAAIGLASSMTAANALDNDRLNSQLMKLDPETRLEQTCDTEVMFRINREHPKFRVDKVIAYAYGDTASSGNSFSAPGAVLRSRGQWYRLKYICKTGPRHLDAHQLEYEIGPVIPRSKWRKHYLYD